MADDLYSGAYLAEALGVARNTIHQATLTGRIEAPAFEVYGAGSKAPTAAWTKDQVRRIVKAWKPGTPGRPAKKAPRTGPRGGGSR